MNTQMTLKRCDCCHGTKRILGMGAIYKDCIACNGIGYKDVETQTIHEIVEEKRVEIINQVMDAIKPKQVDDIKPVLKRRGRRKRPVIQLLTQPVIQ